MKPPKINFRTDYEVFVFLNGNRPLNLKKIEKIKTDVAAGFNLLPYCPVIVYEKDEQLFIIDGQHRFTVSKELGLPVYYVVSDELNLFQIATMNSKQDKWSDKDFLNCYIELGIEDYQILKEIIEEFQMGIGVTAELLMFGDYTKRKETVSNFREGSFKVKFRSETEEFLELHNSLFGRYRFYSDRNLIAALQSIRAKGKCDFKFLLDKIKQAPMLMDKQTSVKEYIYNIERVYNHKASIRKIIY